MAAKRGPTERKRAKESAPVAEQADEAGLPDQTAAAAPASPPKAASAYVVFARRFRPRSFSDVVGQAAATGSLRQALSSGRVAQAYLFCGPRGVGKTSLARIVAKALNCLNGKGPGGVAEEPCNACQACEAIQEGRALDVIEMDAATNRGIEEVRSLRENVGFAPAELRYKVYIIDEVHMLTREAWNAFLKTLEEPPPHVKFIFATTDPNNVPETILSRCQRFDLRRIGPADIVTRLKQICALDNVECEEAALSRIASLARGGLRDAEGLLDQAINLAQGQVTDLIVRELSGAAPDELISEILLSCADANTAAALAQAHQALEAGADPEDLLSALLERLRGALLAQVCGENSPLLEGQTHLKAGYLELGRKLNSDQNMMLMQLFAAARRQMRDAALTRLPLEMALVRASRVGDLVELGKLVSALEASGSALAPRAPPAPPPGREGYRPNLPSRPVGTVDARQAATEGAGVGSQRPAPSSPSPGGRAQEERPAYSAQPVASSVGQASGSPHNPPPASNLQPELWQQIISNVTGLKGGGLLLSALTHAQSVRFDAAAKILALGFTAGQLFYRDALEKAHHQALLLPVLQQVLGGDVRLAVERAAEAAEPAPVRQTQTPPAPPRAGGAPAPAPLTPPSSARGERHRRPGPVNAGEGPLDVEESQSEETEIEFDGEGELPLRGQAVEPGVSAAAEAGTEEAGPRPPEVNAAKPAPPAPLSPAELKAFESQPLVQMVLRATDGVLVGVTRK
ncbi:MAG: DNA polymerase III subunit gamma/tau [Planctomycetota bacterium]